MLGGYTLSCLWPHSHRVNRAKTLRGEGSRRNYSQRRKVPEGHKLHAVFVSLLTIRVADVIGHRTLEEEKYDSPSYECVCVCVLTR